MLQTAFCNSFTVESGQFGKAHRKYGPYVPTHGIAHAFEQSTMIPGRYGGLALNIVNTAFWETTYPIALPVSSVVVAHLQIKPTYNSGDGSTQAWFQVLFARFERNNNNQIGLRMTTTGHIEVVRGGVGDNTDGSSIFTIVDPFPVNQWAELEVRVVFGALGSVKIWREGTLVCDLTTATNPWGDTCDGFTFRWQSFGPPGMAFCDQVIGLGDSNVERYGSCRVVPIAAVADYRIESWVPVNNWSNRPPGLTHYGCLNDTETDQDRESPDDDTSYVAGTGSAGTDLFGVQEPDCFGAILGLALNVAAKALTGSPQVQAVFLDSGEGTTRAVGLPLSPSSAGYDVRQRIMDLSPVTGDIWGDHDIFASAWGIQAAGSGTMRVSVFYLEKIVSLDPAIAYECGGGESYVI